MKDTVKWVLSCKTCGKQFDEGMEVAETQRHMLEEHETENIELALNALCAKDNVVLEYSESGDSGQCPTCGMFAILRLPEGFR